MKLKLETNKKVEITQLLLIILSLFAIIGLVSTYLYLTDDLALKRKNTSEDYECRTEVVKNVKGKYFVFEDGECIKYIDYKNLPDETEVWNVNDRSDTRSPLDDGLDL